MAEKKTSTSATTENIAQTDKTERRATTKAAPKKKASKLYRATKRDLYHPYQRKLIPTGAPGAELEMDGWLECQIEAKLVQEVK